MYHNFFIHSSVDGRLGFFCVLTIANSAAMNNGLHVSLSILVSSGHMPRSRIAGSYGGFIPSFLKNLPVQETWVQSLGWEDPLEEGMATHSSVPARKISINRKAWWAAVHGVAQSRTQLSDFTFTFDFNALEKDMATHSSILAWRIPGMGEPGGLQSMGLHRVEHD